MNGTYQSVRRLLLHLEEPARTGEEVDDYLVRCRDDYSSCLQGSALGSKDQSSLMKLLTAHKIPTRHVLISLPQSSRATLTSIRSRRK